MAQWRVVRLRVLREKRKKKLERMFEVRYNIFSNRVQGGKPPKLEIEGRWMSRGHPLSADRSGA